MNLSQEMLLHKLIAYFEPNQDVLGLILFGSGSHATEPCDEWSDLDVLVVVKNEALDQFFPATDWLALFGPLYTYSQSVDEVKYTTRVCFENFERIDLVIIPEEKLPEVSLGFGATLFSGTHMLFSRSKVLNELVSGQNFEWKYSPWTDERFYQLVRDFRFKSMLAAYKVVRNDLLIALHLSQDLVRDCCVLGMVLRDRATGTNVHKHGGEWNQLVAQLETTQGPFTPLGILESIQASNEIFEKLAGEWSSDYQEKHRILSEWIEKAKTAIIQTDHIER